MNTQELQDSILAQTLDLNMLEDNIYIETKSVREKEEKVTDATRAATETVIKQADDELFKKELSNEAKRQIKIRQLVAESCGTLQEEIKVQKQMIADLEHTYSKLQRTHSAYLAVAYLLGGKR